MDNGHSPPPSQAHEDEVAFPERIVGIRTGVCPECSGTDIRVKKGRYTNIPVMFQHPLITAYICTSCGYIAQFVDREHLGHIVKNWERMDGGKRKNDEIKP